MSASNNSMEDKDQVTTFYSNETITNTNDEDSQIPIPIGAEIFKNSSREPRLNETQTQTEWSWLKDVYFLKKINKGYEFSNTTVYENALNIELESSDDDNDSDNDEREFLKETNAAYKPQTIDSVGPPRILQYVPETRKPDTDINYDEAEEVELTSDDLKDINKFMKDFNIYIQGNHSCEFCNSTVLPWPSIEDQEGKDPNELYCCADYREYVEALFEIHERKIGSKNELINIKPHPKSQNKKDIKLARERAKQRAEERRLEKERKEEEQWKKEQQLFSQTLENRQDDNLQLTSKVKNFKPNISYIRDLSTSTSDESQFAKQIRSINYQLSNMKFVKDGWTVRVPSPFDFEDLYGNGNEDEVLVPIGISSAELKMYERPLYTKYYKNGSLCLIVFPDGTGTVFYKSRRPAIMITSAARGMHIFIVYSDHEFNPIVLAVFDQYGNAYCNYLNGNLRLNLSQTGGIELDEEGVDRKRRWLWWDRTQHVHAPPLQPLIFMLNENIAVKIYSQEKIYLTFTCEAQICNFGVGSRLKIIKPDSLPMHFKTDKSETALARIRSRINELLNLIQNDISRSTVMVRSSITKLPKLLTNTQNFLTTVSHYKNCLNNYTSQYAELEVQSKKTIANENKLTKKIMPKTSRFIIVP